MSPADERWGQHDASWRDPAQILAMWADAGDVDPTLLRARVRGGWWDAVARSRATLLVTREYEHLVLALASTAAGPRTTFLPLPHPSGLAIGADAVYVASTRNPNAVYELRPAETEGRPLVPVVARFYPGALYVHDLAFVGGALHASAAGENCIVRLGDGGAYTRAWWPRSIDGDGTPRFGPNYLQLNSIAAGPALRTSYFTASSAEPGRRRPGHRDYPVDGRGVLFSGRTREPAAVGLTRPHSARLHDGRVWLANSGYGELGSVEDGRFVPLLRLPGWTRGLCFAGGVAFVGTSRVIPRFRAYAPGLEVDRSVCGIHAVDVASGAMLGSIVWPGGNQVFGIEALPAPLDGGLPFRAGRRDARTRELFSRFTGAVR